ncbi:MAG TPA: hypothetical protein VFS23_09620, partial [Vicinamibacterales bacterium]|nr:hypothetical protein [Vicinamibacterales bacterium]
IIERLHRDLAGFPEEGTWRTFLDATVALLSTWIDRSQLTMERLERVIAPLDRFAPTPTRSQFVARVRELIASQVYREGSLADGRVFVGPTSVAAGLRFRVVFVPGLVERRFPSVARPDPLLLDEERAALAESVRTSADNQEDERLEFLDACGSASERLVLSYPRATASLAGTGSLRRSCCEPRVQPSACVYRPRNSPRSHPEEKRPSAVPTRRTPIVPWTCSNATCRSSPTARKVRRGISWTTRRMCVDPGMRNAPHGVVC